MTRLLRRSLAAAALALLPAAAWAVAPDPGPLPGRPGLWLAGDKHGGDKGYRGECLDAARERGWRVRSAGEQKYMNGPDGGTWYVPMRVREGRHSFEVMCEASGNGGVKLLPRNR